MSTISDNYSYDKFAEVVNNHVLFATPNIGAVETFAQQALKECSFEHLQYIQQYTLTQPESQMSYSVLTFVNNLLSIYKSPVLLPFLKTDSLEKSYRMILEKPPEQRSKALIALCEICIAKDIHLAKKIWESGEISNAGIRVILEEDFSYSGFSTIVQAYVLSPTPNMELVKTFCNNAFKTCTFNYRRYRKKQQTNLNLIN